VIDIVSRRLKGLMAERDMTNKSLSKAIGISENMLTVKINGGCDWWYWELIAIVKQFGFCEVREVFPELYNHFLEVG